MLLHQVEKLLSFRWLVVFVLVFAASAVGPRFGCANSAEQTPHAEPKDTDEEDTRSKAGESERDQEKSEDDASEDNGKKRGHKKAEAAAEKKQEKEKTKAPVKDLKPEDLELLLKANSRGRVDYCLPMGVFDISLVSAISAHVSYFEDQDTAGFIMKETLSVNEEAPKLKKVIYY